MSSRNTILLSAALFVVCVACLALGYTLSPPYFHIVAVVSGVILVGSLGVLNAFSRNPSRLSNTFEASEFDPPWIAYWLVAVPHACFWLGCVFREGHKPSLLPTVIAVIVAYTLLLLIKHAIRTGRSRTTTHPA